MLASNHLGRYHSSMNDASKELPYKQFGTKLKDLRQKKQETVSDVSGAVEIDETVLEQFEAGKRRPSQDILSLLITHFGMQDDEAASFWRLAGYDPNMRKHEQEDDEEEMIEDIASGKSGVLVMAIDPRVMYSDGVQVGANASGVVISFAQNIGAQQPLITARVGMSREQARTVINVLQGALDRSEPSQLPEGKTAKKKKSPETKPKASNTEQETK